jgi:excisionase family DNA binding protein
MPRLLKLRDVSEQLGISERTIYRFMEKQLLHPFKIGSTWRFEQADVDNLVRIAKEQVEYIATNDKEGLKRTDEALAKGFEDAVVRTFEDVMLRGLPDEPTEEIVEQVEADVSEEVEGKQKSI